MGNITGNTTSVLYVSIHMFILDVKVLPLAAPLSGVATAREHVQIVFLFTANCVEQRAAIQQMGV